MHFQDVQRPGFLKSLPPQDSHTIWRASSMPGDVASTSRGPTHPAGCVFGDSGRTLPEKQTNSNKRREVALCLFVNQQSRLFRKVSLRPPQNKCCSLELQPKRYFLQYLNYVAQLNLQLRSFEFVCFSGKVRPESKEEIYWHSETWHPARDCLRVRDGCERSNVHLWQSGQKNTIFLSGLHVKSRVVRNSQPT